MKPYSRFAGLALCSLAILLLALPAAAEDLNGNWNFAFTTEAGLIEAPATLAVDGGNMTATMGETKLKGTVHGDQFGISGDHYSPEAGFTAVLKLNGKVDGRKISGSGVFDTYSFTFTAGKAE